MSSLSFREKRALITLLALWIVGLGYAVRVWRFPPANVAAALPGLVGALVLLTGVTIVSHIVLTIGVGAKEARQPSDERDRLVQLASHRNVSWIGNVGLWLVLGLALTAAPHVVIAYAALGAFTLGQAVMYGSELFYYRRGL